MSADVKGIKDKYSKFLLSLPNVTNLGIGPKVRSGTTTSEMAIKVFVNRKIPLSELGEKDRIPESIEGVPTDVEVIGPLKAR